VIIFGGGIIPDNDISFLKEHEVEAIFTPGTPIKEIIDFIEKNKARRIN